ncbi:hypothetical protein [Nocardiopsis synnemataformans]|uniref:hypothetical protein n=1 Tax=Nocardiopsis synnemataformans TaxID=61305 RepID=UPI003EB8441D
MSIVWLSLQPQPERPERDSLIDASYIRGLRTSLLPWKERRDGPHTWALYACVSGEYDGPLEVLRGADEGVRQTVARKLAVLLGAERANYPGGSAVVTVGEETPEGFVFHVERQNAPGEPRMWWPLEYRQRIEEQERQALAQDTAWDAAAESYEGDGFWDAWLAAASPADQTEAVPSTTGWSPQAEPSAAADDPAEGENSVTDVERGGYRRGPRGARLPWDDDEDQPEPLIETADAQRRDSGEPDPPRRRLPWEEPQE